jgi:hypothetical protein
MTINDSKHDILSDGVTLVEQQSDHGTTSHIYTLSSLLKTS